MLAMMTGADMIYGAGLQDCGMALDLGQLVLDNEVIKNYRKVAEGIVVNDETLALETIKNVGPQGHFLMEPSTLNFMDKQTGVEFFNRYPRDNWIAAGSPQAKDLANAKARDILKNHKISIPLPEKTSERLDEIIKEAEKRYCK